MSLGFLFGFAAGSGWLFAATLYGRFRRVKRMAMFVASANHDLALTLAAERIAHVEQIAVAIEDVGRLSCASKHHTQPGVN